ncbi:MAG: MFS transporter [Deltaproteobacteria bacterium]|nr:MFS transporter [Deltaproteobacteria bacterium]
MNDSPTRTRWLIVALIFCMGVLMFIDRVNISIAAKYIMPEYGLSEVQMGWIFSAFVLGYAILQVPGGWLGDSVGPRRVLAGAILWWSVFTAVTAVAGELFLTALVGVVGSFTIVRVLIGIGEAAGPPNYNRLVANWVAPEERGLAMGIAASGSAFGAALTPPLIVWIMVTLGWRAAFYLAGGVGIFLALFCYWFATDRPADHSWVNAAELRYITRGLAPAARQTQSPRPVPWKALLGRSDLWFLTASYFTLGYIIYIYFSWFYLYLVNVRGFSVLSGGWYSTAPFLAGAITSPLGGWLSDSVSRRFGKRAGRCGIGIGGLVLTAGLIWAGAAAADPYRAIVLLALGSASLFLTAAAYWASTMDLASSYAGTVSGFMNMGGNLGGALSPTLTPFLAQRFGWESALYVAAALALLGALFWLGVHPERAIELAEGETGDSSPRRHEQETPGVASPATAQTRAKR